MVKSDKEAFDGQEIKIRFKGVYDMKGLLRLIYKWYKDHQYRYSEDVYKDKVDTAFGNEIEIKTSGFRKVSEYYRYEAAVSTHQWESKDVMVKVGDKEVSMMTGRVEVRLKSKVVCDWQERFKGDFWERMQKWMEKFVIRRDIEIRHVVPMEQDLEALSAEIKKFLKIDTAH